MSGFEVVGIALGVLPIVLHSVDAYKDSIRRVGTTIRKRKHVEKLARALLLQQQILEETVKSVVLACGCENIGALEEDPFGYFSNEDVRERVEDYLGPKNSIAFVGLLTASNDIVKKVAENISGLVPAHQEPTDDLVAIINANQEKTSILVDLAPRVKLLLGITDIKATIQEIDDGTAALDRFSRLILSNRQTIQSDSSRKAVKLAKAFRHIRTFASTLYLAITDGFREECHDSHETRLYLDDRVDIAADILRRVGKANSVTPLMIFDLVFTAGTCPKERVFYETVVQVFDEDDCDDNFNLSLDNQTRRDSRPNTLVGLSFVSQRASSPSKPAIASVASICAAIKEAGGSQRRISFALVGNQPIGTISDNASLAHQLQEEPNDAISLKEILQAEGTPLPWKFRMLLALRLASSLLQLLQTCWLDRAWSKDVVFFLVRPGAQAEVFLNRPFVRCPFGGLRTASRSIEPKVALLELGILLLEIWHKTTLEARFGLENAPTAYYDRMARGVEWLDDVDEPLPDLYDKAVAHCLRVNISGDTRFLDWEDTKLWSVICGDIIVPLAKICKQWSG
ncbi:hypothetical protein HO173_007856 [Letharia columbiana]|uniref:DUF7580 domain-containing protein n=1 Tax=Letharia columbiana TaxID=112416 RepID=A0A8H6L3D7_9LECA|nr:uncharacterized protein HO173_007856 [Letharia columbiana]KAF6234026.1 hypothetical protein HO173_007856 [Letharia columbiana]